ncbi:MAG: NAD(+) synthase [Propionibacteriaceae bacterium]|jgi:NAD+ synthase (glutamine-hydrolysing)|nr:NAD(+) synthase [Propionibacteriaceae bacterium]
MDFVSAYAHGFVRCAACSPPVTVADPAANAAALVAQLEALEAESPGLVVFPELSLTGYADDDLFLQEALLRGALEGLATVLAASRRLRPVVVVGLPLAWGNRVLNCAAVLLRGEILGLAVKSYLPTYREFYERRWFAPGDDVRGWAEVLGQLVPIGSDLIFAAADVADFRLHVELCEDMWVPLPPSAAAAAAGATVLVNLSGSPVTVGRAENRRLLVQAASLRCQAAYVYAAAGAGESSTDLAWDGQTMIFELGDRLAQGERFAAAGQAVTADVDLGRLRQERLRVGTFDDNRRTWGLAAVGGTGAGGVPANTFDAALKTGFRGVGPTAVGGPGDVTANAFDAATAASGPGAAASVALDSGAGVPAAAPGLIHDAAQTPIRGAALDSARWAGTTTAGAPVPGGPAAGAGRFRVVGFRLRPPSGDIGLRRPNPRHPFVPSDPDRLALDCYEAFNIQVAALCQRLRAIGQPKVVIGVSGGLDSAHALIVAAQAMDRLGRPRSDILGFSLPGFATSAATQASAQALMAALGATAQTIDIRPAANQLLADLGHPFAAGQPVYDVTFENVQAGLRTDYLFRAANQRGGIVLGTGDLSEAALGWCTYGVGDQMSHYGVNQGLPKTLIQHLIRWVVAQRQFDAAANAVLERVLAQEISPELVPGADLQSTEDLIGPYALHDFFLFHLLSRGAAPSKIAFLAWRAWRDPAAGDWPPGWPATARPAYGLATIRGHLAVFLERFFAHQFKRSAQPNGPKVLAGGALSPRGDWRMPADARATAWLAELDAALPPDRSEAEWLTSPGAAGLGLA